MGVNGKEEGRGTVGLGLIRMDWIIEDVQRQREARRNRGRERQRQGQMERQRERIYRSLSCVLRRVYLASVVLDVIFFCLPFVDPQLQSVSSTMYG